MLGLAVAALACGAGFGNDKESLDDRLRIMTARSHELTQRWTKSKPSVGVFPSFPYVPANHLKFYLQFKQPMERGDVFKYVKLLEIDRDGSNVIGEVPDPFREVELWDDTFTRFTLWLHPGRQKPGVNLNVEIGPILEAGRYYRLVISGGWPTETGRSLGESSTQFDFDAGPPDNEQTTPMLWHQTTNIDQSNMIEFRCDDVFDRFSFEKSVRMETANGAKLEGAQLLVWTDLGVRFPDKEEWQSWFRITLRTPIPEGRYRLIIDPKLEDLAGNSIARPFNLDLKKQPNFKERTEPVIIPFEVPARVTPKP